MDFHFRREYRDYADDPSSYRRGGYDQRIRRGRIFDSYLSRVQAGSDEECEIKNAFHLLLFRSSAGDYGPTLKEVSV